jgi:hypothetical protein
MVRFLFNLLVFSLKLQHRFTFTGGNNVTLRGTTDPQWGWIDGHGQAVHIISRDPLVGADWHFSGGMPPTVAPRLITVPMESHLVKSPTVSFAT